MNQGFLLFAYDNEEIEYGLMALWCSQRIKQHLKKTSSLVTDYKTKQKLDILYPAWIKEFDEVIFEESNSTQTKRYIDRSLTFHNLNRVNAWEITPYDETIVIDTDVIIQSNQFNKLWNNSADLIVCDTSTNIQGIIESEFKWISDRSIKFLWATAFYFKKTEETKLFFNHCQYIKENYNWFKHIYELMPGPVRNDFIWSIALHSLGGNAHSNWVNPIPWNLIHANPEDRLLELNNNSAKFLTNKTLCKIQDQDVHVMNKFDLMNKVKVELGITQ